eukprot:347733-Pyramimonas_sp.AAC.1
MQCPGLWAAAVHLQMPYWLLRGGTRKAGSHAAPDAMVAAIEIAGVLARDWVKTIAGREQKYSHSRPSG